MKTTVKISVLLVSFSLLFIVVGCFGASKTAITPTNETEAPTQPLNTKIVTETNSVYSTNTPETILNSANVQPAKYSLDIKGAEWLMKAAQEGLSFRAVGIYAINDKVAFLFGSFMSGTNDVRSVLFRTEDGGQNWREVMPSFTTSEVSHVLFVQDGKGWATIGWTSEGLLGTTFWRTSDYGKSWEEIPNVNTGRADVLGISFFDSRYGQRVLFEGTGNPNTDGLVLETTLDGGNTWTESLRYISGMQDRQKIIAAYAVSDGGRYGRHWGTCKWDISSGCQALGHDGSEWNVTYDESATFYIVSIRSLDKNGLITYKIPVNFIYDDGELHSR